jgi:hypothetical protein
MNQKNLNALNKIHKNLLNYLKDQKINQTVFIIKEQIFNNN